MGLHEGVSFCVWGFSGFLSSALANFLGSLIAAAVVWGVINVLYELPRTRRERGQISALAYALVKREVEAAAQYCEDFLASNENQVSIALPITQGWETLHSIEAFKLFPEEVTEKLVAFYSMVFRLRKEIDLTQMFLFGEQFPMTGENPYRRLRQGTHRLARGVAENMRIVQVEIQQAINREVQAFSPSQRHVFERAYETTVGTDKPRVRGS